MIEQLLEIIFLALGTYFLFTYLAQGISFFLHKTAEPSNIGEGISVIVCAHNEYQNLKELIPLLLAQQYDKKEIIVINDRSQDDSYDFLISQRPAIKLTRIDNVPDYANGKKFGLTMGVKAASYDRLVFTDADCRPDSPDWLAAISSQFTDDCKFVLGYSQYQNGPGLLNQFIRFETMVTGMLYLHKALTKRPYMGVGRNLAYRKSLFMEVNGFGQKLGVTGGDDDLFVNDYAHGKETKVVISPLTLVKSIPKTSWSAYFKQKKRHLSVGKFYKISDKIWLGLHGVSQTAFWLTFAIFVIVNPASHILWAVFGTKLLMQGLTMWYGGRKTGDKFDFWLMPLLDFIYSILIPIIGINASFSKQVKWK